MKHKQLKYLYRDTLKGTVWSSIKLPGGDAGRIRNYLIDADKAQRGKRKFSADRPTLTDETAFPIKTSAVERVLHAVDYSEYIDEK